MDKDKDKDKDTDKNKDIPSTPHSLVFSTYPNVSLAQSKLWEEIERDDGPLRPRFRKKDLDDRRRQVTHLLKKFSSLFFLNEYF